MKKITAAVLSVVLLAGCGSAESKALEIDAAELGNHITYYEVTPENWEEYFEWSKERVYQTDAFGEQTGNYSEYIILSPKNEYIIDKDLVMRVHVDYTKVYTDSNGVTEEQAAERDEDIDGEGRFFYGCAEIYLVSAGGPDANLYYAGERDAEAVVNAVTLTKSAGYVYTLDLPESAWQTDKETGEPFFVVLQNGTKYRLYKEGKLAYETSTGEVHVEFDIDKHEPVPHKPTTSWIARYIWQIDRFLEQN